MSHKAGFVSIIGKPNAGKSTLMNALVGENMSIITPKAQTTRHRILGIVNDENHQIVFSDTPGVIKPKYTLQESMMQSVKGSLSDADFLLFVTDIHEKYDEEEVVELFKKSPAPVIVLINKIDQSNQQEVNEKITYWQEKLNPEAVFAISALHLHNVAPLLEYLKERLPEHPPYFEKDQLTDKNMRFFVSEKVREKIFLLFAQEIPYSTEVVINSYKEEDHVTHIMADIIVERDSQKNIIIGKGGEMIKKVGTRARKDIEEFIGGRVYLELFVKVVPDWRKKKNYMKQFGYD